MNGGATIYGVIYTEGHVILFNMFKKKSIRKFGSKVFHQSLNEHPLAHYSDFKTM